MKVGESILPRIPILHGLLAFSTSIQRHLSHKYFFPHKTAWEPFVYAGCESQGWENSWPDRALKHVPLSNFFYSILAGMAVRPSG